MKICTITHHSVPNFGAVLQAYALQTAIKNLGFDSEVLNYRPLQVKEFYHKSLFAQKSLKEFLRHIVFWHRFYKRNSPFDRFVRDNIKCSKLYSREQLRDADKLYDLYISGSDQVWNLSLHRNDTSYMLDFVTDKKAKASYAASFGYSLIPSCYSDATKKYLADFQYLNVREENGCAIVRNLLGKDACVRCVVDPTLLLDKKAWLKFVHPVKYENYILVYEICRLNESYEYANMLSKRTGKTIVVIQPFDNIHHIKSKNNIRYEFGISVEEFLSLIFHADYVITSSFHGTVFSIIFRKAFFCTYIKKESSSSGRIENLLDLLGLKLRMTGMKNFDNLIEYDKVEQQLTMLSLQSKEILRGMIEERKNEVEQHDS